MSELTSLTPTSPITKKSRLPRYRRVSNPPRMVLTERDHDILRRVYAYRLLTREQIERLLFAPENGQDHFTKTSKACKRLKLLFQHGYLERIPLPVGPCTWAWQPVYRLARKGAELIAAELGVKVGELGYWGKNDDQAQRHTQATPLFLQHTLALNDVRLAVVMASQQKGYRVEKWLDDAQLKSQEMKEYVAVIEQGNSRKVAVIPDAYFVLHLGDRRAHFFLELDRATMSNPRWRTRVLAYLSYIRSGKYAARYQTKSLRILTVTTTAERLSNLRETTRKAGGGDLFWFTTLDQVSTSSVLFDPIWRLVNEESEGACKRLVG